LKPGGVGEELAEVGVVSAFELVFDEDPVVGGGIFAEDVGTERPDGFFLAFEFKLKADDFTEKGEVVGLSKPGGEVTSFVRPSLAEFNFGQATERGGGHGVLGVWWEFQLIPVKLSQYCVVLGFDLFQAFQRSPE
jgi:hypothetical protein